jgi:hypothetical protein
MIEIQAQGHTRRNLIIGLGVGAAGAAAAAYPTLNLSLTSSNSTPTPSWWDRMFLSLQNGGTQEWSSVIGQIFSIESENGAIPVLLGAVKLLPSKGTRPIECSRTRAFMLVFYAALDRAPTGDRTYKVTHHLHPPLDVFLSPAIRFPRGVQFQAVFN